MQIGDVVVPNKHSTYQVELVSGAGHYDGAIVCSLNPFVLVSFHGDMRWDTVPPHEVMALCQAHPNIVTKCIARLEAELRPIYIPLDHMPADVVKVDAELLDGVTDDHAGYEFYVRQLTAVEGGGERVYAKVPQTYWAAPTPELTRLVKPAPHVQTTPRDDLPTGFVLLQVNPDYAADLSGKSVSYGYLYKRDASGIWGIDRQLLDWEIMQAEDQRDQEIVIDGENNTSIRALGYHKA